MAAGLSHWRFGRFDLYRVNPPLARLVATAPVALLNTSTNWDGYSRLPGARSEFDCGEQFIAANGERSFLLFVVARWACIPFSLLGGYICYRWAGELYGDAGGLLALALWSFCPNILAHAQMITPDVSAAALGTAACYAFWRWLRAPSWTSAFVAGVALGLAELTKATFLVLYTVWPAAWLAWRLTNRRRAAGQPFQPDIAAAATDGPCLSPAEHRAAKLHPRPAAQLVHMALLSIYLLNLGYAFEGSLQPLGNFNFMSHALGGLRDVPPPRLRPGNRFAETALSNFRVPLPANYILGIDQQKRDFEHGYSSYLRGEWHHGGWWYYYLYGLAIKVPLGTWALILMAIGVGWTLPALTRTDRHTNQCAVRPQDAHRERRPPYDTNWQDEFVLLLPAAVVLTLVSLQTGFNHHLRYVLPVFPLVFIWVARLGRLWSSAESQGVHSPLSAVRRGVCSVQKLGVVAALGWSVASSLWYYPHSLSYFNELVGGPLGGRWHMLDSNLDWGQDLLNLRRWLNEHPEANALGLAYFGYFDPRVAGIEFSLPPRGRVPSEIERGRANGPRPEPVSDEEDVGPLPGWYAVSVTLLHGYRYSIPDGKGEKFDAKRSCFSYFQHFQPVGRAGYSIFIYHLRPDDVDRVRRELGLPGLTPGAGGASNGQN